MKLDLVMKHTHATANDIRPFVEDKTGKLEKYVQGEFHAKWTITYENDEHISHLHVTGSNSVDYFGEGREHNLMSSVEDAVERVERQLKKHKEINKDHHR